MQGQPAGGGRAEPGTRWAETYDALSVRSGRGPLDVADLERLAVAAFFVGRDAESAEAWEHAHRVWLRLGDRDGAGRCAFWLWLTLMLRGEGARANGWFSRGRRVVGGLGSQCAASGYMLIPEAMEALVEADRARSSALYEEVTEIAKRCGDADLLALGLLGRGEAAIAAGETKVGLALLDEVMVAATTGEVSPLTTGILYCAVVDACVKVFDLRRAAEWTDALTRWCEGQPGLVPYRGQCLVHRSQVLQAHGAWRDALAEAVRAQVRLTDPPHPALGVAYYQQAELHRLRGDFAKAEEAYRKASEHGHAPTPGLALLRLAQGKVRAADVAVRRMLEESQDQPSRLAVLPAYVTIVIAAGDVAAAAEASEELCELARTVDSPFVTALADQARAAVLLAEDRPGQALDAGRRACELWRKLDMPYEAAQSQAVVAKACRALGDADAAAVELHGAAATLARLGARPDVEALAEPVPASLPRTAGELTARECDVLRLVAAGKTNREIASVLVISEHTVARHLQNIFTKMRVPSRAAATAYAYEHGVI